MPGEEKNRIIEITVESVNKNCPEFLTRPLRNYFGEDDKYDIFYEDKPDMIEVLSMPRKCNNFFKWLEYTEVYERYIQYLVNKYGHEELIRSMVENGETLIGEDKIPSKPILTKKKNKILLSKGILPSQNIVPFSPSYMKDILEYTKSDSQEPSKEEMLKRNEFIDNSMQKSFSDMERQRRVQTMKTKKSALDDSYDFIMNFYNAQSSGETISKPKLRSLSSSLEEEDRLEFINPEDTGRVKINSQGVYVTSSQSDPYSTNNMNIVTALQRSGFDVIGTFKNEFGKKGVKMIKSRGGIANSVSDKELKKWEKKRRKNEQAKLEANKKLSSLLTGNRIDLEELSEMTNFSIRDMNGD